MKRHRLTTWTMCLLLAVAIGSCRTKSQQIATMEKDRNAWETVPVKPTLIGGNPAAVPSPPLVIYKTKKDYSHNVPVTMDDSRTRIIAYPDPRDLKAGGRLTLPDPLDNGYWLDNRGIGKNVAFLSFTYEEYARLDSAPSMEVLLDSIIDKNPLLEIIECGRRSDYKGQNPVDAMNDYIRRHNLK